MPQPDDLSCAIPFTPDSSVATAFHVFAAMGGGAPHRLQVDTGSVGTVVPRTALGPDYQHFHKRLDTTFGLISSGKVYRGQWVTVPVILGVPETWDGTGDYPMAEIDVFAVDEGMESTKGLLGVGFAIEAAANGGQSRNLLLNLIYQGQTLNPGYIIRASGMEVGLTPANAQGFSFVALDRDVHGAWAQPIGTLGVSDGFSVDLPVLIDTGIPEMILFLNGIDLPGELSQDPTFPADIAVSVSVPPGAGSAVPALQYAFTTGRDDQPMAPTEVDWRSTGTGINTGRHVLAGVDYLYDALNGRVGYRVRAEQEV